MSHLKQDELKTIEHLMSLSRRGDYRVIRNRGSAYRYAMIFQRRLENGEWENWIRGNSPVELLQKVIEQLGEQKCKTDQT